MQQLVETVHDRLTAGNALILPDELAALPAGLFAPLGELYPGEDFGENLGEKEIPRHKALILTWILNRAEAFSSTPVDLRNRIVMSLVAREAMLSCGIGNGLALPHCKTALIENELELVVTISPQPLEWFSVDGAKTTVLLLALFKANTPDAVQKRMQYSVILARLFRETGLVESLSGMRDPEQISGQFRKCVRTLL